jgi:serine/threonine protein kinase
LSNIEPTSFGDKYVLVEHIATGGMAEIYRANYTGIEGFAKELVIKRLREEYAAQPSVVQMFLDEARVAATLTHNNVVHTYDLGELYGEYYIAMEYLKGQELVDVLRRSVTTGMSIPMYLSLGIIMQSLEGLYYVHSRADEAGNLLGLCHRDINPTNIHVGYDGVPKIVDFGIAATRASLEAAPEGQFAGKLSYMAPEQIEGRDIDMRADIFAMGVVLYEMCLGRRLFRGPRDEVIDRILEGDIPAPTFVDPEFPPALEAVIMKALEVLPSERYQNCDHMYRDLDKYVQSAGLVCTARNISAYMAEMFGEGAPAEVNYDDQYDDLVDEALDFDRFDNLESSSEDEQPEWVQSLESSASSQPSAKKRTMTIGNLEDLVANIKVDTATHRASGERAERDETPNAKPEARSRRGRRGAGGRRRATGSSSVVEEITIDEEESESDTGRRRRPRSSGRRAVVGGRVGTGAHRQLSRSSLTSSMVGIDPTMSVTGGASFGHGIMTGQSKKGGALVTWLLVALGLGGFAWIAYSVFTMK